jgi:hypothetical protein
LRRDFYPNNDDPQRVVRPKAVSRFFILELLGTFSIQLISLLPITIDYIKKSK